MSVWSGYDFAPVLICLGQNSVYIGFGKQVVETVMAKGGKGENKRANG